MRKLLGAAACAVFLLAPACAPPSAPAGAEAQAAAAAGAEGAQAEGAGAVESEAAYRARCRNETLAQYPDAANWVDNVCQENWTKIARSAPVADAILAVTAGGPARDAATIRSRAAMVQWAPGANANGTIAGMDVALSTNPAGELTFGWSAVGELSPYDVEQALRGRAVTLDMIGCLAFGVGESTKVWRATAPGGTPFALTIYDRGAPTANASAFYSAGVNVTGRVPTLAQLNPRGDGYEAACPN